MPKFITFNEAAVEAVKMGAKSHGFGEPRLAVSGNGQRLIDVGPASARLGMQCYVFDSCDAWLIIFEKGFAICNSPHGNTEVQYVKIAHPNYFGAKTDEERLRKARDYWASDLPRSVPAGDSDAEL